MSRIYGGPPNMVRPATYRPITISHGLRTAARRTPHKIAFSTDKAELRFDRLIERVDRVCTLALGGLGLAKGDRAALMSYNSIEFIEIVCGLSEIGVPAAMISPHATPAEIAYICNDSGARVLFVHPDCEERAHAADLPSVERILVVGPEYEQLLGQAKPMPPKDLPEEWDLFSIPYTSGTTGQPKGVMLSHRARVGHMMFAMAANTGAYRPTCRSLAMAPFFNGAGFIYALAPAFFGGSCHIMEKFEAEQMLRAVSARGITAMFMVPTHFAAMFALGESKLAAFDVSSILAITSNAAPLSQALKERIVPFFGDDVLFESYGTTEAGSVTSLPPEDQLRKVNCVGLPVAGAETRIIDADGLDVPTGEIGEILVRSPWLFNGYWNRPDATDEAFMDGWYRTGDLARCDEGGFFYLVDRTKNVIITGGQNVYPREIEEVLLRHPSVADAAVVGVPDEYWGEAVTACLVLKPETQLDVESLRQFCRADLAGYKVPKAAAVLDAIPRNPTGKILHRVLRDELARGALRLTRAT